MTAFLAPPLVAALSYALLTSTSMFFSGLSISLFLVSAGQQMPSWLEVEEAHGDVTSPAPRGASQSHRSLPLVC